MTDPASAIPAGRLPVADRATVRRASLRLLAADRRAVVVMLALHIAAVIAGLASPWLLGRIIDVVTAGGGVASIDRLALAIGGSVLVHALLVRFAQYAGHRFGERAIARLREDFVWQTLGLPVSVVERAGTGDLATRSSVDVTNVGTAVRNVLPIMVITGSQLSLLFGAIFLLQPLLGVVALVGMPIVVATSRWYLRRATPAYLAEGAAAADLTDALTSTAEGPGPSRPCASPMSASATERSGSYACGGRGNGPWPCARCCSPSWRPATPCPSRRPSSSAVSC